MMTFYSTLLEYNYREINGGGFLFLNQLPSGPIQLLQPSEQVKVAYQDYESKIRVRFKPFTADMLDIAFVSVPGGGEYWHLLHVIASLNAIKARISIYCTENLIKGLKEHSNSHIQFYSLIPQKDLLEIEANIFATFSLGALYFMMQQVPVVIVGPHGLGGWVTPESFPFMSREGFLGRPGGELWEPIPAAVFMDEVLSIKRSSGIDSILYNNALLAKQLNYLPFSLVESVTQELEQHYAKVECRDERWKLVPSLASNILFIHSSDKVFITRQNLNETIASVEDVEFFQHINGANDFNALFLLSEMEEEEFWTFIYALVKQKVIVY